MLKDDGLTNKYIGIIDQLLGRKIRQVPFLSYTHKKNPIWLKNVNEK